MSREVDDPAKQAAGRPRLPVDEILPLYYQIDKDREWVRTMLGPVAAVISNSVKTTASRLAKLDLDVFPEVTMVGNDGTESTTRLLEVPGSGRGNNFTFDVSSYEFSAVVTYITPEGRLVDLTSTRRDKGKRAVFVREKEIGDKRDTHFEYVVKFQRGIFDALEDAAYRGVNNPKNHRPVPSAPGQ